MTIGESLIQGVSIPLANTVFSPGPESETFESVRQKAAELLVTLDMVASAAHDLEQVGKNARAFREEFESTERRMHQSERESLGSLELAAPDSLVTEEEARDTYQGFDGVESGKVTTVTNLLGEQKTGLAPGKYHAGAVHAEESFQRDILKQAQDTQRETIREPLDNIVVPRRTRGGAGGDTSLSLSVFSSPRFKGRVESGDFDRVGWMLETSGLQAGKSNTDYVTTALQASQKNMESFERQQESKPKPESKPAAPQAAAPAAAPAPRVMISGGGGGGGVVAPSGGGGRTAASFSRSGAFSRRRRRGADDEEGGSPSANVIETDGGPTAAPTTGTFTSGYGSRWGSFHDGIDIGAPIGTPIYAAKDGVVIDSGPAQGFGNWIRIQHEDGTITTYGHMSTLSAQVGDEVRAGDYIAGMGSEGQSTGSHLHFRVTAPDGSSVDPLPWLQANGINDWG